MNTTSNKNHRLQQLLQPIFLEKAKVIKYLLMIFVFGEFHSEKHLTRTFICANILYSV